MAEIRRLSFKVEGEFITKLAREKVYLEGDMEYAMQLLLSCMDGTDMEEHELRQMAFSIINGEAELKGTYSGDDYGFEYLENKDDRYNLASYIAKLRDKCEKAKKETEKMTEWYITAMNHVPEYERDDVLVETGQKKRDTASFGNSLLDGFMKRMLDEEEHTTEDYGWLAPDGSFYGVEWGNHQEWAQRYMEESFPEVAEDDEVDMQVKCNVGLIGAGDWLVEHGWVLLHNPSQGIAFPTRKETGRYTKAQKEFLYNYYLERNCEKEANAVYQDEED